LIFYHDYGNLEIDLTKQEREEEDMAIVAGTANDVGVFCQRHPKANGPTLVDPGRMDHLAKEGKLQRGPFVGSQTDGTFKMMIRYALTKPTGNFPYGEIITAVPRSSNGHDR